jgi:uncharacterized protein YndB with AHSA1/START domain
MLPVMASIRIETTIEAPSEKVWEALRAWDRPHEVLVPGFVVDTRMDGEDRIVSFFNGATVREVLIDLDEDARRLVWSVVDGPYTHHNGAAQVLSDGNGATRFVWTADLLPNEAAKPTRQMMERGAETVKQTLEVRVDA